MNRKTILLLAATITLLIGWRLTRAVYAVSTTVTVDRTSDASDRNPGDGICDVSVNVGDQCSLRAAIEELNALGPDTSPHRIEFDISGTGPFTITPNSELPAITVPLVIDGETQPGASCPTSNNPANLLIVLDGSNAGVGTNVDGLTLDTGSEGSVIRGVVIGNFDRGGIFIGSNDNKVRCNHLGVGADGLSSMGNGDGIFIIGANNTIGGQVVPAQRNVISANTGSGIYLFSGGDNNRIRGNFIGTTADGLDELGNVSGIYMTGDNNIIGGTASLAGNVISGNSPSIIGSFGIRVNTGDGNVIQGNYIGVAKDGTTSLPNIGSGVELFGDAIDNVVGGTAVDEVNLIAFNGSHGVTVQTNTTGTPLQNEIRGNVIYANGGLGIDLGDDSVDSNDPGDGDNGENEHQNYPVLVVSPGSLFVDVMLDSQANITYQIDFYRNDSCDQSGFGEGQAYLGTEAISTGLLGFAGGQYLADAAAPGDYITATATDPDGNTSEFSMCALLEAAPTPTPTNTPTATNTPTVTTTSTPTNTPSPTATATVSPIPTATSSPTVGPSPTATNTPPPANTPTPTGSATPTAASFTPTATATSSPSPTPTLPPGVTPTATAITSPTPAPTQDDSYFIYLPIIIR